MQREREEIFDEKTRTRGSARREENDGKRNNPYREPEESFASRQVDDNIVQVVTNFRLRR